MEDVVRGRDTDADAVVELDQQLGNRLVATDVEPRQAVDEVVADPGPVAEIASDPLDVTVANQNTPAPEQIGEVGRVISCPAHLVAPERLRDLLDLDPGDLAQLFFIERVSVGLF